MYRQCKLVRLFNNTQEEIVSYIPNKYATVGKYIKLLMDDIWIDGWKVISVGEKTDIIPDIHKRIKGHRKSTGDSMRKSNNISNDS